MKLLFLIIISFCYYLGYSIPVDNCFGIPAGDPSVCSGYGICLSYNNCDCYLGYSGLECELYYCFGKLFNDTTLCNSHGICDAPNTCFCDSGYYGLECELWDCFGIIKDNPNVCNSHGICDAPNTCICDSSFYGVECDLYECFGIIKNDSNVCNSHGICDAPNTCICTGEYTGIECQGIPCENTVFDYYWSIIDSQNPLTTRFEASSVDYQEFILIFGGSTSSVSYEPSVTRYNTITNIFTNPYPPQLIPRQGAVAIVVEQSKQVYIFGGRSLGTSYENRVEVLDLNIPSPGWRILNNTFNLQPNARIGASGAILGEYIYILGGMSSTVNELRVDVFYIPCFCWINTGTIPDSPFSRYFGSFEIFDNKGYFFGGFSRSGDVNILDIPGATWLSDGASYPSMNVRIGLTSSIHNEKIYVFGGLSINGNTETVDIYDINSNSWSTDLTDLQPYSRYSGVMGYHNKEFYFLDGKNSTNNLVYEIEKYGYDYTCSCFGYLYNDSLVCSGNGVCVNNDLCECDPNWLGSECNIWTCNGIIYNDPYVCSVHGICVDLDNCTCNPGYYGNTCETWDCYSFNNLDPDVCCDGNGNCISPDNCTCSTGYSGALCEFWNCYGANVVGTCIRNLLPPRRNLKAQVACSLHGNCTSPDTCVCESGWFGSECNIWSCNGIIYNDSSVCSGNGNCIDINTCLCDAYSRRRGVPGYGGNECQYWECYNYVNINPLVCSSHGNCIDYNNCSCIPGYNGDNCDYWTCDNIHHLDPVVCSSHGECIEYDVCNCTDLYIGDNCSSLLITCFGLPIGDPNVCGGYGICIGQDICECYLGHYGIECKLWDCFGQLFNYTNICNSHGICDAPDACFCDPGYYGLKCELHDCFGIIYNDSSVCGGHGICIDYNNCSCTGDWSGDQCNEIYCFGKLYSDFDVCSQHGACIGTDDCDCYTGYSGDECDDWGCYGIDNDDANVCNGHGVCTDYNTCSCEENYSGDECELFEICVDLIEWSTENCDNPDARLDYAVDTDEEFFYLFGGRTSIYGIASFNDFWRYNISSRTWYQFPPNVSSDPLVRIGHQFTIDSERNIAILHAGEYSNSQLKGVHIFNMDTETWYQPTLTTNPGKRSYHQDIIVDGKMYTFGGLFVDLFLGPVYLNDLWEYDIDTETFTKLFPTGDIPGGRYRHKWVYHRGIAWLYSGEDASTLAIDDMWVFNITTLTWREIHTTGDNPVKRSNFAFFPCGLKLCLFGGRDELFSRLLNDLWRFDPDTETWEEILLFDKPAIRSHHDMVSMGIHAYLFSGYEGGALDDFWRLTFDEICYGCPSLPGNATCEIPDKESFICLEEPTWTCNGTDKNNATVCYGNGYCASQDDCKCFDGTTSVPKRITRRTSLGLPPPPPPPEFCENKIYGGGVCTLDSTYCSFLFEPNDISLPPFIEIGGICDFPIIFRRGPATPPQCICNPYVNETILTRDYYNEINNYEIETYFGPYCNQWSCGNIHKSNPKVCYGHGICSIVLDDAIIPNRRAVDKYFISRCQCQNGYNGTVDCSEWICNPECINGECIDINLCKCECGWTGDICDIEVTCDDIEFNCTEECPCDCPPITELNCTAECPFNCAIQCPCLPDIPTNCTAECPCLPDIPTNCTLECPCLPDIPTNCTTECPCLPDIKQICIKPTLLYMPDNCTIGTTGIFTCEDISDNDPPNTNLYAIIHEDNTFGKHFYEGTIENEFDENLCSITAELWVDPNNRMKLSIFDVDFSFIQNGRSGYVLINDNTKCENCYSQYRQIMHQYVIRIDKCRSNDTILEIFFDGMIKYRYQIDINMANDLLLKFDAYNRGEIFTKLTFWKGFLTNSQIKILYDKREGYNKLPPQEFCRNSNEFEDLIDYNEFANHVGTIKHCYGVAENEYEYVCNGHGICKLDNHCECENCYYGAICESKYPPWVTC